MTFKDIKIILSIFTKSDLALSFPFSVIQQTPLNHYVLLCVDLNLGYSLTFENGENPNPVRE